MDGRDYEDLVSEATLQFTLGNHDGALALLDEAEKLDTSASAAWHARAEILLDLQRLDEALAAAERGAGLSPDDVYLQTTLSRIWVARGDKDRAEHHGAQARILSWKAQLSSPDVDK